MNNIKYITNTETANNNFYPTPEALIDKMLQGIDFYYINSVLEPSAGKGDIAHKLQQKYKDRYSRNSSKPLDIDCIEIDSNLRHILKGNGLKVIHDNFLTYDAFKKYDLIIMNPPFDCGDKHLLKAIDIQSRGGKIVCLLNAETIRNPYSNIRKDLIKALDLYDADIQFISDSFLDAERKTNVEIALVKIDIPRLTEDSEIYSKIKKASDLEYKDKECTDVVVDDFMQQIIQGYKVEVKATLELFRQYRNLKPYMWNTFGEEYKKSMLVLASTDYNRGYYAEEVSENDYLRQVRYKYWSALFSNEQFTRRLTSDLLRKFQNMLEDLKDYDFTEYNIKMIMLEMNASVIDGVKDSIMNLFDKMTAEHSWYAECTNNRHYYDGWASNKAHKINKKVILPCHGVFDDKRWGGNFRSYKAIDVLKDIEKSLNYISGQGTDNQIDLGKAIDDSETTTKIQCKYFQVSFFKKGTMHIVFTDLELLDRLNIYAARERGWLPPSYGKKSYKDMTQEEKNVVNGFQGEKEYNNVFANKSHYIIEQSKLLSLPTAI